MADEHAIARYRYWYRKLLSFYSRPYRERFAESIEQTFNDLCRERAEAGEGLFGFVLWVFVETSAAIIRENVGFIMMQKNIIRIALGTMEWYFTVLRKYAVIAGRARRKEYWMFVLISAVVVLVLGIVNGLMGADVPALPLYYTLAVVLPGLAVTVRRLHDTDRSGWWLLILLVPIVGAIVFLVFMATPGGEMANRFGASPKAVGGEWLGGTPAI